MASTLSDLPDDIIQEIFFRLPPKSLLRCRAVCKTFRSLFSDRRILAEHHRRQPRQPLFYCPRDVGGGAIDFRLEVVDLLHAGSSRSVIRFTEEEDHRFCGYGEQGQLTFHGSCGCLLLVSFADSLYVCNPATRQWIPVPPLDAGEIAGLYEHLPTGEYRVLYHRREGPRRAYYILTVGSGDEEGRSIGRRALSASMEEELLIGPPPACWQPPVLLRSNLHWPPQEGTSCNNLLVFDTVAEAFRWLPAPPMRQLHSVPSLFEMDGMLALSSHELQDSHCVNLWILQDYDGERWVQTHNFKLESMKITIQSLGDVLPSLGAWIIVSPQGGVLIECIDRVFHLINDKVRNLEDIFDTTGRYIMFTRLLLTESLIPHPFFEIDSNGGVEASPPPFFSDM